MAIDTKERYILEELKNPVDVDRGLQSFRKSVLALSSDRPRLIERYPKQWVAIYKGEVQAHGKTFLSVLRKVDRKKLPREHVVMRFIDRNQRTMIL